MIQGLNYTVGINLPTENLTAHNKGFFICIRRNLNKQIQNRLKVFI